MSLDKFESLAIEQMNNLINVGLNLNTRTEQTRLAVTKATQVLAMLHKSFKFWNPTITRRLYTTFIRPHLEYAVQA